MNPYDERRLIDEVIYLHSLWHQGPPQAPPPPNPILTPTQLYNNTIPFASDHHISKPLNPYFNASPWHLNPHRQHPPPIPLAPAHTGSLPPTSNNKKKKNKNKKNKARDRPRSPGLEWPCPAPSDPPSTGWPAPKKPRLEAPAVSPEEKERLGALRAQNKASQALRGFILNGDDDDCDDDDDDYDDAELEEYEGFFLRIFKEDDELRSYYQRRFENGEFCCLVCDAVGKKNSGKKYKDCVGLLQHAKSVLRTVKKLAHRAFGQAVCKVLGWDIDQLPVIAMKGEPLGSNLKIMPSNSEDEVKENADDGEGGTCKQNGKVVSMENNDQPDEECVNGVEQSIVGCSVIEKDLDNKDENLDEKILDIRFESGEGGAMTKASLEYCDSNAGWVFKNSNSDSSSTASVWPLFQTNSSHCTSSLSAEEQANVAVQQLQHKALKAYKKYLVANADSDSDDEDSNEEDEDDVSDHSPEKHEDFKFFLSLFTEDSDLRIYYENNNSKGDFYCLVCGAIGKKVWKKFKDCIALLQHSTAVKRTKRKQAHRAYSQVICKVLGWDIERLPTIVLKDQPLSSSLEGSTKL
ncbi:hypothetical protein HN51_011562 [Arachis hypogaea]|uniref:Uncharacterized protein n=1 Tax=Arachis hypogaea TaxID=3818 RepID=A0A445DYR1_ARAHY|nr:uncharacterized protein LOC112790065 [Arachis hypogaea]XP_025688076.1 uncharacterized protein LOC112790065 [Arachis hypogaea]QHO56876.1 uncharacterized protein DS421_3g77480 [Arachis hypogaea]RYR68276.1 hypothetical protein Ahy_A03g014766 [Arachis hypogaea]